MGHLGLHMLSTTVGGERGGKGCSLGEWAVRATTEKEDMENNVALTSLG